MFFQVLLKSLPQSVLAPWSAVLIAGFPKVWANIPRLLVDPFVLESRSQYDFSDEKLQDNVGIRPQKLVKNLGAAEPRYVLQSPGLVENCVGLYVPLLEFNHHLDEDTGTELESEIPSHTQNDDLLVKVPSVEQILCRGRFRHPAVIAGY